MLLLEKILFSIVMTLASSASRFTSAIVIVDVVVLVIVVVVKYPKEKIKDYSEKIDKFYMVDVGEGSSM